MHAFNRTFNLYKLKYKEDYLHLLTGVGGPTLEGRFDFLLHVFI